MAACHEALAASVGAGGSHHYRTTGGAEMTALAPISMDDVRRLRFNGYGDEADNLLRVFRESCGKNKKRIRREFATRDQRIRRHCNKAAGLCLCYQPLAEGKGRCRSCLVKYRRKVKK